MKVVTQIKRVATGQERLLDQIVDDPPRCGSTLVRGQQETHSGSVEIDIENHDPLTSGSQVQGRGSQRR